MAIAALAVVFAWPVLVFPACWVLLTMLLTRRRGGRALSVLRGIHFGLVAGLFVTVAAGAFIGGIYRLAPCQRAPDFASGALAGAIFLSIQFGPAGGILGALAGGALGFSGKPAGSDADRVRPRWTIGLMMAILAFLGLAFAMARPLIGTNADGVASETIAPGPLIA